MARVRHTPVVKATNERSAAPLLRWAGSKRALLDTLLSCRPPESTRYLEPFAGSACLFFALRPEQAVLGDHNPKLIAMYRALRDHPEEVGRQVHNWATNEEAYYEVRGKAEMKLSSIGRAARFIYLNRLCFNGVYRTNRQGDFNVPYGRNPGAIPSLKRFVECGNALQGAHLVAGDFEKTLESARSGDFIYLDPPYSRAASDSYGVYGYGSFHGEDLSRLILSIKRLDAIGAHVLLSYRQAPELMTLQGRWTARKLTVSSQVAGRPSARTSRYELLVANYDISKFVA